MSEAQVLRILIAFLVTVVAVVSTVLAASEAIALSPVARLVLVAANAGAVTLLAQLKGWTDAGRSLDTRTRETDTYPHG